MCTNINIKKELIEEVNKKELTNPTSKIFIEIYKRNNLMELKGKINFHEGYDYKNMREGK